MSNSDTGVTVVEKRKVGRPAGNPNTKLAQCKELYNSMNSQGRTRPEILAAFVANVGCTAKSAEVYFYKSKSSTN